MNFLVMHLKSIKNLKNYNCLHEYGIFVGNNEDYECKKCIVGNPPHLRFPDLLRSL